MRMGRSSNAGGTPGVTPSKNRRMLVSVKGVTQRKLSGDAIQRIIVLCETKEENGMTLRAIAQRFGVSSQTIRTVFRRTHPEHK
jgi:hypothetical protein